MSASRIGYFVRFLQEVLCEFCQTAKLVQAEMQLASFAGRQNLKAAEEE